MSRRRWCRSAGSGAPPGLEEAAPVCDVKDLSILLSRRRRGPRPADHTPSRSWRLPDLFFRFGHSDGRDRLGARRPPPAGVRAPHRALAPCSAREAVALRGHPLYYKCFGWFDPVRADVFPIHGLSPRTARPPRGREEARSAGRWGSFEGWRRATPPCEERGAQHDATSTFQQTMTGEFRAGHGRLRPQTGREDQADATTGGRRGARSAAPEVRPSLTGGSVVCRSRFPSTTMIERILSTSDERKACQFWGLIPFPPDWGNDWVRYP